MARKWRIQRCPYCGGDLENYRRARFTRLKNARTHRGVKIQEARKPIGFGFTLNGRRYLDQHCFLSQEEAFAAALSTIDELLDSAKVQALDDE
jgi:hypothetical protein